MREKILKVTRPIFAWGLCILMTLALIGALLYIVAFIIGGEGAMSIHEFCTNVFFHCIYIAGIVLAFLGIVNMYLAGEKMYMFEINSKKNKPDEAK